MLSDRGILVVETKSSTIMHVFKRNYRLDSRLCENDNKTSMYRYIEVYFLISFLLQQRSMTF